MKYNFNLLVFGEAQFYSCKDDSLFINRVTCNLV